MSNAVEHSRLRSLERKFHAAFNAGNAADIASYYHPDGLQLLPAHPPVCGRSSIQSLLEDTLVGDKFYRENEYLGLEMAASCDYAVSYGITRVSGWNHFIIGGWIKFTGTFVTIYRKIYGNGWEVIFDTLVPQHMNRELPDSANNNNKTHTSNQETGVRPNANDGSFDFRAIPIYDWNPKSISPDIRKDQDLIRENHVKTDEKIAASDSKGFAQFYSPNGMLITPGFPVAQGHLAIQEFMQKLLQGPSYSLPIRYHGTVVSNARDLAFTYGEIAPYIRGSYYPGDFLIVHRRSDDGQWKAILDATCPCTLRPGLLGNS